VEFLQQKQMLSFCHWTTYRQWNRNNYRF